MKRAFEIDVLQYCAYHKLVGIEILEEFARHGQAARDV
jgi:hypothetical protein